MYTFRFFHCYEIVQFKAYFCEILLAKTAENCVHYDYDLNFFWKIIIKGGKFNLGSDGDHFQRSQAENAQIKDC